MIVREGCFEAWLDGEKCEHQRGNVTPIRRQIAEHGRCSKSWVDTKVSALGLLPSRATTGTPTTKNSLISLKMTRHTWVDSQVAE